MVEKQFSSDAYILRVIRIQYDHKMITSTTVVILLKFHRTYILQFVKYNYKFEIYNLIEIYINLGKF